MANCKVNIEPNDISMQFCKLSIGASMVMPILFNVDEYLNNLKMRILVILSRTSKTKLTYDILDTDKSIKNKLIGLKEKQRQMKIGEIFQFVLGSYDTFEDLGVGHESGLDILSNSRKIVIELKNRTNTDNSSSRKANFDKLVEFKTKHPEYECIYGCINDSTEAKTQNGDYQTIIHNGVEIKKYIGAKLLALILGKNSEKIIKFVRETIDELT